MAKNRRGVPRRRKQKKSEVARRPPSRYAAERMNYEMHILMGDRVLESAEEINEIYGRYAAPEARDAALQEVLTDTHRAQFLAYDAMDAPDREEAARLAGDALDLDPRNIDARACLLVATAEDDASLERGFKDIIQDAEVKFGADYLRENRGRFWGLLETRPYMRALQALGQSLIDQGRYGEAADVYLKMLSLNEHDNQGARYSAVTSLMVVGRLHEAQTIVDRFEDDDTPLLLLADALLALIAGDSKAGKELLFSSYALNNNLMKVFLDILDPTEYDDHGYYSPGSPEEALFIFAAFAPLFEARPALLQWVLEVTVRFVEEALEETKAEKRRKR